jgi:hypothetical protein
MMQKNIGPADRVIRALIGLFFLLGAWVYSSWILLAVALFCFYEAIASWCLMYQLMGKSSCPIDKE